MCWPTDGVSHHPTVTLSQWQSAEKERYSAGPPTGDLPSPSFWCSSPPQSLDILLLPSRRAEALTLPFVTHNTPGGAHTWKENIYCFLLRTAFPASHSSTGSRHRKQTACQQEYSTTQEHGNPPCTRTLATWAGSQGKGASNLYSSQNSPSALPKAWV